MKSLKMNAVQLGIASVVVLLVAFCATFAWYAVGNNSKVDGILANVASPSTEAGVQSGISEIQIYNPDNGEWNTYDGEVPLNFVPGQSYKFKVIFKADKSQQTFLRMTGFEETNELIGLLEYSVKFTENGDDDFQPFSVNTQGESAYAEVLRKPVSEFTPQSDGSYVVYYTVQLPRTVESEGFDHSFSANVELIFA